MATSNLLIGKKGRSNPRLKCEKVEPNRTTEPERASIQKEAYANAPTICKKESPEL